MPIGIGEVVSNQVACNYIISNIAYHLCKKHIPWQPFQNVHLYETCTDFPTLTKLRLLNTE